MAPTIRGSRRPACCARSCWRACDKCAAVARMSEAKSGISISTIATLSPDAPLIPDVARQRSRAHRATGVRRSALVEEQLGIFPPPLGAAFAVLADDDAEPDAGTGIAVLAGLAQFEH